MTTTVVNTRQDGFKGGITPVSGQLKPRPRGQVGRWPAGMGSLLSHDRGRGRPRPGAFQE
jgi:hypothetical protein